MIRKLVTGVAIVALPLAGAAVWGGVQVANAAGPAVTPTLLSCSVDGSSLFQNSTGHASVLWENSQVGTATGAVLTSNVTIGDNSVNENGLSPVIVPGQTFKIGTGTTVYTATGLTPTPPAAGPYTVTMYPDAVAAAAAGAVLHVNNTTTQYGNAGGSFPGTTVTTTSTLTLAAPVNGSGNGIGNGSSITSISGVTVPAGEAVKNTYVPGSTTVPLTHALPTGTSGSHTVVFGATAPAASWTATVGYTATNENPVSISGSGCGPSTSPTGLTADFSPNSVTGTGTSPSSATGAAAATGGNSLAGLESAPTIQTNNSYPGADADYTANGTGHLYFGSATTEGCFTGTGYAYGTAATAAAVANDGNCPFTAQYVAHGTYTGGAYKPATGFADPYTSASGAAANVSLAGAVVCTADQIAGFGGAPTNSQVQHCDGGTSGPAGYNSTTNSSATFDALLELEGYYPTSDGSAVVAMGQLFFSGTAQF